MTEEPEGVHDDFDDGLSINPTDLDDLHERERKALACCPKCGSRHIRRSHRHSLIDILHQLFGRGAYRCRDCRSRFHASRSLMRI